ncbi:MAG: FKBP-type peptidyl-prolyl cis-trans isomerase [Sphingobacteriaceae bacterium]
MKRISKYFIPVLIFAAGFSACTKQYASIEELDSQNVAKYIQDNNLNMLEYNETGIFYKVVNAGTGPDLDYTQKLPLIYTIKTLDGTYTSVDTFVNRYYNYFGYFKPDSLREVLKNSGIKQGGSLRVIIPSRYAYGRSGTSNIAGNSSIDYTISVITADKIADYEDFIINKYLQDNSLTGFSKTATGLYYKISNPGSGTDNITTSSTLTLEYSGKLLNGTVFDKTATGATATFLLSNLIDGWKEALPLIKEGGSIRIIVPSSLGYGLDGNGSSIPPFATLDFEIKVTDIVG